MHLANPKWNCTDQKEEHFIDGITNGASWSSLSGGMQDYNYVHSNCFEITLELGCDRFPKGKELRKHWGDNKNALMELLQQVGLVSQATHLCKKQTINFTFFLSRTQGALWSQRIRQKHQRRASVWCNH